MPKPGIGKDTGNLHMSSGIKLTMLVDECFQSNYVRDDEALYWLLSQLKARLQGNLEVENRAQSKWPKDKLTKTANDSNMVELRKRVGEALGKLGVLHQPACTKTQAREAWDWVFQSDGFFEAYDKDSAKAKALFANSALVRAGLAATTPSGIITAIGAGAGASVANLPHRFYGELPDKQ